MDSRRTPDDLGPADDADNDAVSGYGPGADRDAAAEPGLVPTEVRFAAIVLCLQAVGLLAATTVLVIKTVTGHPDSLGRALLGAAFALFGAVLLVLAARSILQLHTVLRSPIITIELLALPVGYSMGFQAHRMAYAGPLLISAVAVLYLLFTPAARGALFREFQRR